MSQTRSPHRPSPRPGDRRHRPAEPPALARAVADAGRFGPAPTPRRELAATAVNVVLLAAGAGLLVLLDAAVGAVVLGALAACYLVGRALVARRRWADAARPDAATTDVAAGAGR
ncbi:hypothetical protein [Pseudokineococcus lusitanus]|uniref:Uncharacterized protein n=1 Tax=Pseudokineococcus lusitanus TaxID=763993 RepID=A0A3N1HRP1_9ACTN|nr:hypothetical protein [Pseudokineococcus lusitanus]ROP45056.1 hypothetical protein EDC03_1186 [Pseudokineococcus lusitanus]